MAVKKRIIQIPEEKYKELKKDFSYTFDLYLSDNKYYIIATIEELHSLGIKPDVPFI